VTGNRTVSLAAAALGLVASDPAAVASGCDRQMVAHVKMRAGACWAYRGAATTFVGDFSHGRTVSVLMSGEAADYDPRTGQVATLTRPRDPNVEGPGGFFFGDAEAPGALTFVVPANGTYRFSFSPCAMWHELGTVKICVK